MNYTYEFNYRGAWHTENKSKMNVFMSVYMSLGPLEQLSNPYKDQKGEKER